MGRDSFWGGLLAAPAVYRNSNKMSINTAGLTVTVTNVPAQIPLEVDIDTAKWGTVHAGARKLTGPGGPANGKCVVL